MQRYDNTTWPQLYSVDYNFSTIYRQLQTDKLLIVDYFLKDTLQYKLGQLGVPTNEH